MPEEYGGDSSYGVRTPFTLSHRKRMADLTVFRRESVTDAPSRVIESSRISLIRSCDRIGCEYFFEEVKTYTGADIKCTRNARAYTGACTRSLPRSIFFHGRYFPFTRERMQTRGKRE
jgi:hypothetical protein